MTSGPVTGQARIASPRTTALTRPARRNAGFGTKTTPTYMASRRVKAINPDGSSGWLWIGRARKLAAKNVGELRDNVFHFKPVFFQPAEPSSLNMPPLIDIVPFFCDAPMALQEGFLRYPQQTQTSVGPKFPGIECFR